MAKTKKQIHLNLKLRIPHVILDTRNADPALLEALVPGLEHLEARVRILGQGAKQIPHVFSLEEALEEAHIWVVLSKELPKEFATLVSLGIVPVMPSKLHPAAENYSPSQEKGNAFLFPELSPWYVYGALIRALENFGFSYDWESLRNNGKTLLD